MTHAGSGRRAVARTGERRSSPAGEPSARSTTPRPPPRGCDDGPMSSADAPTWGPDMDHLNGLDEVAVATDPEGRIVFANEAARRLHPVLGDPGAQPCHLEAFFPDAIRGSL